VNIYVSVDRQFASRVAPLAVAIPAALLLGYFAASPSPNKFLGLAIYGSICVACALAVPAHVFLPVTLVLVGVSTAFTSPVASAGPAALYVSDLVVLLVFLRGVLPRIRRQPRHALAGVPQLLFLLLILVMAAAAVRSLAAGLPVVSVVRSDLALFYWPLLYFGFTRILAEETLDSRLLWRNLALVAVGFAVYMFVARALNHPFQDPGLAQVPTGQESTVPRNFGFASAFTIYPVLAVVGVAGMANDRAHRLRWTLLASLGIVATASTLVRGEIFSLALGILLVLVLSPRRGAAAGRSRAALQLAVAAGIAVLVLLAIDPKLGHAVVQRTVPFTHQAEKANQTADYRFEAMSAGVREARKHPAGRGVLDEQRLVERGIDPGFIAHSGFATLLIFGGWIALALALLTVIAAIRRSFAAASATNWLHPAFVGAICMLSLYTLGAAGLAGDSWVVPLGALVVALRFGLDPKTL
jgi:hypothetical protein